MNKIDFIDKLEVEYFQWLVEHSSKEDFKTRSEAIRDFVEWVHQKECQWKKVGIAIRKHFDEVKKDRVLAFKSVNV